MLQRKCGCNATVAFYKKMGDGSTFGEYYALALRLEHLQLLQLQHDAHHSYATEAIKH